MTKLQYDNLILLLLIVGGYAADAAGSTLGQIGFDVAFGAFAAARAVEWWIARKEQNA